MGYCSPTDYCGRSRWFFAQIDDRRFKYNGKNTLNEMGFYVLNDIRSKLQ